MEELSKSEVLDLVAEYVSDVLDTYESNGKDDFLNHIDDILEDVRRELEMEDYELTDRVMPWIREDIVNQSNRRLSYDLVYNLFNQIDELKDFDIHETEVGKMSYSIPVTSACCVMTSINKEGKGFKVLDTDLMVVFSLLKEYHPTKTDSEIVEGIMDKKVLSELLDVKNDTYFEVEYKNRRYRIYEVY